MQASDGFTMTPRSFRDDRIDEMRAMEAVLALSAALSSAKDQRTAGNIIVRAIIDTITARRAVLLIQNYTLISEGRRHPDGIEMAQFSDSLSPRTIPTHLLNEVMKSRRAAEWRLVDGCTIPLGGYEVPDGVAAVVCVPMVARTELVGLLYVEMESAGSPTAEANRDFLDLVANVSAAVVGLLQSHDQVVEVAQKVQSLGNQLTEFKALTSRMTRLGRGGAWVWQTGAQSMSISPELRSVLGLMEAHHQGIKTIWDLEIRFGGQIPPVVLAAVADGLPFETEIEIVRPADEILTTLLLVGEPDISVPGQFVGLAFDIGPQLQRGFVERDHAILEHRLEELRRRAADPLTSILLDTSAAERFLRRNHPDYEMVFSALGRIEGRASLIADMIDEAPTASSRPENYQWIRGE